MNKILKFFLCAISLQLQIVQEYISVELSWKRSEIDSIWFCFLFFWWRYKFQNHWTNRFGQQKSLQPNMIFEEYYLIQIESLTKCRNVFLNQANGYEMNLFYQTLQCVKYQYSKYSKTAQLHVHTQITKIISSKWLRWYCFQSLGIVSIYTRFCGLNLMQPKAIPLYQDIPFSSSACEFHMNGEMKKLIWTENRILLIWWRHVSEDHKRSAQRTHFLFLLFFFCFPIACACWFQAVALFW